MMFGKNPGTDETWKRIPTGSVGVELGVWKGESSEKFLRRAGHLHLVDPWSVVAYENSDEFGDYQGYLDRYSGLVGSKDPDSFQKFYNKIHDDTAKKFKNAPITIHRMTTDEFFEQFDQEVDWVYVDALHSFEGCLSDLRNARKIIKSGGSIFGDDYGNEKYRKEGVERAVDQFIKETGLVVDNFFYDQFEIKVT